MKLDDLMCWQRNELSCNEMGKEKMRWLEWWAIWRWVWHLLIFIPKSWDYSGEGNRNMVGCIFFSSQPTGFDIPSLLFIPRAKDSMVGFLGMEFLLRMDRKILLAQRHSLVKVYFVWGIWDCRRLFLLQNGRSILLPRNTRRSNFVTHKEYGIEEEAWAQSWIVAHLGFWHMQGSVC